MARGGEEKSSTAYWGLSARPCESCCGAASAVLFCRADAAFLCGACDARVHGAEIERAKERGRGRGGHERVWLCEVCEQAPAAVACKADAAALCAACDADIHSANPLARRHERLPLPPFLCPLSAASRPFSSSSPRSSYSSYSSAAAAAAAADGAFFDGCEEERRRRRQQEEGVLEGVLEGEEEEEEEEEEETQAEAASWLLAEPNAKGVPPEVVMAGEDLFFADNPYLDLNYAVPVDGGGTINAGIGGLIPPPPPPQPPILAADVAESKHFYGAYPDHSLNHSMSSSEAAVVPDATAQGKDRTVQTDREARVLRYREKRKNRRFEKTVRYASRKAYAETRPRIKGRFARRAEVEAEVGKMYSSAAATVAALMADSGYGIVPSTSF